MSLSFSFVSGGILFLSVTTAVARAVAQAQVRFSGIRPSWEDNEIDTSPYITTDSALATLKVAAYELLSNLVVNFQNQDGPKIRLNQKLCVPAYYYWCLYQEGFRHRGSKSTIL
jgi:hypothetical protein